MNGMTITMKSTWNTTTKVHRDPAKTITQYVPAVLSTTASSTGLGGEELPGAAELLGLRGSVHVHDLDHALSLYVSMFASVN